MNCPSGWTWTFWSRWWLALHFNIYTVLLPNAAILEVAKCGQPNKNYGASSYMAYASLEVLCFNA
jgi:hypothetical protein